MKGWKTELELRYSSTGHLNTHTDFTKEFSIFLLKALYSLLQWLSHCVISNSQYMPIADILTQSVSIVPLNTPHVLSMSKKRNHILFQLLSIKQSLPPASLHIRVTQWTTEQKYAQ